MNAIYLLPIGGVEKELVRSLEQPLRDIFHAGVAQVDAVDDVQTFYDAHRGQYNSTAILKYIKECYSNNNPKNQNHLHSKTYLAVTAEDLFIPVLTYVFGEAELGGNVAVVSSYRLLNERYGLPPSHDRLIERLTKEAVHELGHVFGLVHCSLQECVMHSSTYAEDIDLKGSTFCRECARMKT